MTPPRADIQPQVDYMVELLALYEPVKPDCMAADLSFLVLKKDREIPTNVRFAICDALGVHEFFVSQPDTDLLIQFLTHHHPLPRPSDKEAKS